MSTEVKSDDKKDIEMEEREKIMNAENIAQDKIEDAEVAKINKTDNKEGREVKPKKIPIGGIQMPGFFTRSRSKEKCKDNESDTGNDAEGSELLDTNKEQSDSEDKPQRIKLPNPFGKKTGEADKPADQSQQRKSIIDTIRIPLVSVFPRKSKQSQDQSLVAQSVAAGLASMETLDDNDKTADKSEDEMKNVKLDADDKTDPEKQHSMEDSSWRAKIRAYRVVISALLVFILILIVIIVLIIPGRQNLGVPIKNGKYIEAATSCGPVEGMLDDGAFAFRGIPYALAPIGEERFKPAQALNRIEYCWNGTLLTHNATDVCTQLYADGTVSGVEDCLTLDVVTPYVRYDTPLPVIVLIGAESLMGGSPGKMRPSPRYARSRDVLFVRPNFRMGPLGFLALETLSKSTHPPTSGNYGLSDIIQALYWVQLNIENFGGDPKAVTLFGHRAGASLITALASSKYAKNLFARAWATSGGALYPGKLLAESEQANMAYLETINCNNTKCLRKKTVEELIEAVPDTWRKSSPDLPLNSETDPNIKKHEWMVLDGNMMKYHPAEVWANGDGLPVKLVLGSTAHASASEKLFFRHTNWTPDLIKSHIQDSLLGKLNLTEDILNMYPSTYQGLVSLVSDIRTVCPLLAIATQQKGVPFYVVTQTRGEENIADIDSDVDAILGRYEPRSPEQRRYVAAMQQLFYHYVWHGEVLQTENIRDKVLVVGQDVIPATNYTHCDFWINKDIVPKYAQLD